MDKSVCGSYGIQHISQERHLGGIPPTSASDNRHRDHSPNEDPAVVYELVLAPLSHGLGAPGKYCLRQSPPDESAFVEVLVSREIPAYYWTKNYNVGGTGEGNDFTHISHPTPFPTSRWHDSGPKEVFWARDFPYRGKWEHVNKPPASLAVWDVAKKVHFTLIQSHDLHDWGRKRLGEWHTGLSEGIIAKWVQLTASWTPSRSPTTSHWERLTCNTHPHLAHGHPHHSLHVPHAYIPQTLQPAPCAHFWRWRHSKLWQLASEHTPKTKPESVQPEKGHRLEL